MTRKSQPKIIGIDRSICTIIMMFLMFLSSLYHPCNGFSVVNHRFTGTIQLPVLDLLIWRRSICAKRTTTSTSTQRTATQRGTTSPSSSFSDDNTTNHATAEEDEDELSTIQDILRNCAIDRSVSSDQVIDALERLESSSSSSLSSSSSSSALQQQSSSSSSSSNSIALENVQGNFLLVFSSGVAKLPFVGSFLDGYLPNKEWIVYDFRDTMQQMSLSVETFPFIIPTINIIGNELKWDEGTSTLSYQVKGKDRRSEWKIVYADDMIVAGKSSVTGWNVIRRVVDA